MKERDGDLLRQDNNDVRNGGKKRNAGLLARIVGLIGAISLAIGAFLFWPEKQHEGGGDTGFRQHAALSGDDRNCEEFESTNSTKCQDVLFVTNRAPADGDEEFGDELNSDLTYGVASVRTPVMKFQSTIAVISVEMDEKGNPIILEKENVIDPAQIIGEGNETTKISGAALWRDAESSGETVGVLEDMKERLLTQGKDISAIDPEKIILTAVSAENRRAYLEGLRKKCNNNAAFTQEAIAESSRGAPASTLTSVGTAAAAAKEAETESNLATTDECSTGTKWGVNKVVLTGENPSPSGAVDHAEKKRAFRAELQKRLADANTSTVTLYIHGYDTTFLDSVSTAADIAVDLGGNFSPRRPLAGVPVAFSWATELRQEAPEGASDIDRTKIESPSYYRSQRRADQSTKSLADVFGDIVETDGVDRIVIVAHSMGNRVLMQSYSQIVKTAHARNKKRPGFDLQIVNFAGDFGVKQYKEMLASSRKKSGGIDAWTPRISNYYSRTDLAMFASHWAQWGKGDFYSRKNWPEFVRKRLPKQAMIDAASPELGTIFDELSPAERNSFFKEDRCRIGFESDKIFRSDRESDATTGYKEADERFAENRDKFPPGLDSFCRPAVAKNEFYAKSVAKEERPAFASIDMTGFGPDEFRHGYFEFSPMVLSDISCELAGYNADAEERALIRRDPRNDKRKQRVADPAKKDVGIEECRSHLAINVLHADYPKDDLPDIAKPVRETMIAVASDLANVAAWDFGTTKINDAPVGDALRNSGFADHACAADALVAVGLSSREGMRSNNSTLAQDRAKALNNALADLRCAPTPIITLTTIGQACRNGDCSDNGVTQYPEDGSATERPVIVVTITGSENSSETAAEKSDLECMAKEEAGRFLPTLYSNERC